MIENANIHYRALNQHKTWTYFSVHDLLTGSHIQALNLDMDTLGQCTGLVDGAKCPIYQGDIIQVRVKSSNELSVHTIAMEIDPLTKNWTWFASDLDRALLLSHCKVLGNKHENSDLVELYWGAGKKTDTPCIELKLITK